jgi:alanine racemase
MRPETYNSYLEIDLTELKRNIEKIREGIGPNTDIIAVLKGNAYGMGLVPISEYLARNCDIRSFACAQVHEAVQLRVDAGMTCDI